MISILVIGTRLGLTAYASLAGRNCGVRRKQTRNSRHMSMKRYCIIIFQRYYHQHVRQKANRRSLDGTPSSLPQCDFEAVEALNTGIDANSSGSLGTTPPHIAAEQGDWDTARLLLGREASPWNKDENNAVPLHLAAEQDHLQVAYY